MNTLLRERDPGLQPERTAMSWHRTASSAVVLALVITRSGVVRGDMLQAIAGCVSTLLSLVLVGISFRRQQTVVCDTDLTSRISVKEKRLLCIIVGLNALIVTLYSVANLL